MDIKHLPVLQLYSSYSETDARYVKERDAWIRGESERELRVVVVRVKREKKKEGAHMDTLSCLLTA